MLEDGRFTIEMDEVQDMFQAPPLDPLAGRFLDASGMERLVESLSPREAASVQEIQVSLPGTPTVSATIVDHARADTTETGASHRTVP